MSKEIEGKFKGRAVGQVVLGTSKAKGTPFIECYFRLAGGEHDGEEVRWVGYFSDSPSGKNQTVADRTIASLQYCGWGGDDLSEFSDGELHGLDANEVLLVVEMEEYQGQDGETRRKPRVQWVNKIGGYLNVEQAMTQEAAQSFAERMRAKVLKGRERNLGKADESFSFGANAAAPKATGTGGPAPRKGW